MRHPLFNKDVERKMSVKFMKCILLSLLLAGSAGTAAAASNTNVDGLVLTLQHYEGHSGVLVKLDQQMVDPESCGRSDWYIMPDSSPRAQLVQSILLQAQSMRRRVYVTINGCLDGMPKIIAINNGIQ